MKWFILVELIFKEGHFRWEVTSWWTIWVAQLIFHHPWCQSRRHFHTVYAPKFNAQPSRSHRGWVRDWDSHIPATKHELMTFWPRKPNQIHSTNKRPPRFLSVTSHLAHLETFLPRGGVYASDDYWTDTFAWMRS